MAPGLSTLFTYDVPKNYTAITFGNNSLVVAQSDSDDSMIMAYENDIPKGYKTMKSKKGNNKDVTSCTVTVLARLWHGLQTTAVTS